MVGNNSVTSNAWARLKKNEHIQSLRWRQELEDAPERIFTEKRVENLESSLRAFHENKRDFRGYPSHLTVEPTNACNLQCTSCPTKYRDNGVRRGRIDARKFRSVLH